MNRYSGKDKTVLLLASFPVVYSIILLYISPALDLNQHPDDNEVILYVSLRIAAGLFYFAALLNIIKGGHLERSFIILFAAGLFARIILIPSNPVLEDDYYRYLWDGAVTANFLNPYEYSPEEILLSREDDLLDEFGGLISESGNVFFNINHPHIRTIYPMTAQIVFALSYLIDPFNPLIWKLFLLAADLILFFLLLKGLARTGLNRMLIFIYWLNPVFVHEFYNAAHMDLLMYPLLAGALLYYTDKSYSKSSAMLSIAAGIKVWPLFLILMPLKKLFKSPKELLLTLSGIAVILSLIFAPVFITSLDESLGFIRYAESWANNDAFFRLLTAVIGFFLKISGFAGIDSFRIARWITLILFTAFLIYVVVRRFNLRFEVFYKTFLLVTVLYFMSPTQFPWYYTWILPFLVFNPRVSLLLYAVLLPLYQLNYLSGYLVWVQHIPVIIIFLLEEKGLIFKGINELGVK